MLDVARITQGRIELRRESVDLVTLIDSAVEATRPLIDEHQHDLRIEVPLGTHRIAGDRTRLLQIVTNLLTNAAKYTPTKGTIQLTMKPLRDSIELRVRDTGIGIPAAMLPRIFELFVQGSDDGRWRSGLGIGLNLVRRLVELHGGTITATSDGEDRGSEFVVELPISGSGASSSRA